MELDMDEMKVKHFMYNLFTPALHKIVSEANPTQYQKWGGNACRQTAVFGVHFLQELLPDYEWEAWDGDFSEPHPITGQLLKYNHAWIYGVNKKKNKGLIVDLSRVNKEKLFLPVKSNKYPKDHPEYKSMRLIRKEKIDVPARMDEQEYYTTLKGKEFIIQLLNEMERM